MKLLYKKIFIETMLALSLGINLILWMPRSLISITVTAVLFFCIEFVILNLPKNIPGMKQLQGDCFMVSIIISTVSGYGFWKRGTVSPQIKAVLKILSLTDEKSFDVIVILMSVISIFFLYYILCLARREKRTETLKTAPGTIQISDVFVCSIAAFLISLQSDLSPVSASIPGTDSSVFIYIGKMMQMGKVPYTELFDHKGIILYFIQWVGLELGKGSYAGIWFIEIVNLLFFSVIIVKIVCLFTDLKIMKYGTLMIMGLLCRDLLIYGGNLTEEYALPWITMALYIFIKYFISEKYKKIDLLLIGVSFSVVFFLRANMIAVWVFCIPVILWNMVKDRKWTDIRNAAFYFLLGALFITVPLFIYLILTGSLGDMIQNYLLFNVQYSGDAAGIANKLSAAIYIVYSLGLGMLILAFDFMKKENQFSRLNMGIFAVSLVLASMSGRPYSHYGTVLLPTLIIPTLQIWESLVDKISNMGRIYLKKIPYVLLCILVLYLLNPVLQNSSGKTDISEYLQQETDREDDVLIIGSHVSEYLLSNRYSSTPYFYQTPLINISESLLEKIIADFESRNFDIIIVEDGELSESSDSPINRIMAVFNNKGIYQVEEKQGFRAYRQ